MKKLHKFCEKFGYDIDTLTDMHAVLRRNRNELMHIYFDINNNIKAIRAEVVMNGLISSNNIFVDEIKFLSVDSDE